MQKSTPTTEADVVRRWTESAVTFVEEAISPGEIQPEQIEILEAIANNQRIAVRSGHGIGKTAGIAFAIMWYLVTRPEARIVCTAPTRAQLADILWAELAKWFLFCRSKQVKAAFEMTKSRIEARKYPDTWFAVARTANKPENLQGFHAPKLLIVVDEASGVSDDIMQVIEGALTGPENRLILIGNPTRTSGMFYRAFHAERGLYKTLHFNSENSKIVSKQYIERMSKYGKDSDIYRVRVLGDFPSGEPDSFIPLYLVDAAQGREEVNEEGRWTLGVDPARFGNDSSVICIRNGYRVRPFVSFHGIDTQRLAGEVIAQVRSLRKYGALGMIEVRVDDTGVGGGVTDALRVAADEEPGLGIVVVPINFGGSAYNPDYADFGAVMWGEVKSLLPEIALPKDEDLAAQLTTRKYSLDSNGRIKLEKKMDMKKRNLPSPDRADALALAFAPIRPNAMPGSGSLETGNDDDEVDDEPSIIVRRTDEPTRREDSIIFGKS